MGRRTLWRRRVNTGWAIGLAESLEARRLFAVGTLTGAVEDLGSAVGPDAADPVRNTAYVVDQGTAHILAISTATGTTSALGKLAASVSSIAVSADDTRLFAAEPSALQVEVFSLPSLTLLKTLNTGVAISQIAGAANDRFVGATSNVQIFDAETGTSLYSVPNDPNGLIRTSPDGTRLYTRARSLSGNNSLIHVYDLSGTGAPAALTSIPGPVGANSTDFAVDPISGHAYMGDGGASGIEVTSISSGNQTSWQFDGSGSVDGLATLLGGQYVYASSFDGRIQQFNQSGTALNNIQLVNGHNMESLVITPNGVVIYTSSTGIGAVNLPTLNVSEVPHLVFTVQPPNTAVNATLAPAVQVSVEDPGGNIISTDQSPITLSLVSGTGVLSGTLTENAVNGVATFSDLSINATGTKTLQAASGNEISANSNAFNIGTASLRFVHQPTNSSATLTITPPVTVEVVDQNGQLVTNATPPITLAATGGQGTLSGTLTVTPINGIATFPDLSIDLAGTYNLTAADGSYTGATSTSFTVSGPSLRVAQQPTSGTAGQPLGQITIDVLNAAGNIDATDASPVTLSVASGTGILSGNVTANAHAGVATFNGLSLGTGGVYTLMATDPGVEGTTTQSILISPAVQLSFAQQPTTAVANTRLPAVQVLLTDQLGNPLTGQNPDVTLAVASGPSTALAGTLTVTAKNGIAIFSDLSLQTAGAYTLIASVGNITATSNSFAINPAAPAKVAFLQQPSDTVAGATLIGVQIGVEDAFGNLVSANRSHAKLSLATATARGSLHGNTSLTMVHGTALASRLSFTKAGTYSFKVTDGSLSPAFSSAFSIAPQAPAKLVVAHQPTRGAANLPLAPLTINLLDAYKNLATTATGSVSFDVFEGSNLVAQLAAPIENGQATLTGYTPTAPGHYRIVAQLGILTVSSHGISVSA